jgi:hypothetical protein
VRYPLCLFACAALAAPAAAQQKAKPDLPDAELTGKAEGFTYHR